MTIGPAGGTVDADGGEIVLDFPAGAVAAEIDVHVASASSPPVNAGVILARAYDLSPDGAQFQQPVSVTIHYEDAQVPAGVAEDDLRVCKAVAGDWQTVPGGVVDTAANTVTADLMSFSTYAPGSPTAGGEASITLTPAVITMPTFGTKTFAVVVEGLENQAVTWSVVEGVIGGRIRGFGVYNAPAGGGVFHVRATSVEDPSVYGEAEVTIATDWECPEEPPEPAYELVWVREVPSTFQDDVYGIDWCAGYLWVVGMGGIMHWTDTGEFLGWSGLGAKPDPDGPGIVHTYIGYHAGIDDNDSPHPWPLDGAFSWNLNGLACDASGNVYVCDYGYHRIQKMSPGGILMDIWENDDPQTVAVNPGHEIFVSDQTSLFRYTQAGVLVETITDFVDVEEEVRLTEFKIAGFTTRGEMVLSSLFRDPFYTHVTGRFDDELGYVGAAVQSGRGMCEAEQIMTVDDDGNLYTAGYPWPLYFKKFDRDGWLLAAWPTSGPGYEDPRAIGGMTVDVHGNVYVTDWMNGMILKFAPAPR